MIPAYVRREVVESKDARKGRWDFLTRMDGRGRLEMDPINGCHITDRWFHG